MGDRVQASSSTAEVPSEGTTTMDWNRDALAVKNTELLPPNDRAAIVSSRGCTVAFGDTLLHMPTRLRDRSHG